MRVSPLGLGVTGVTVRYPGVVALDEVTFDVQPGEVHAICGENGAGKSTLGRVIAGIVAPDAGHIRLGGRAVHFTSPRDARGAGVAMVHQELSFCENLSVAENLCLGAIPARRGVVQRRQMRERADAMLRAIGTTSIDVTRSMESLSIAEQQLVQIASAVGAGASVIVFDEPTSSLGEDEAERLFSLIRELKARGVTQLYVSHRMPEIFRLSDAVTVLRDGRHVITQRAAAVDEATLVQQMIGRQVEQYYGGAHDVPATTAAPEVLSVRGLSSPKRFQGVSFTLHAGEVLGLAGLVGAGRSEIAAAIFGLDPRATGTIRVDGREVRIRSPRDAMALGLGLVPEDRKKQGVVLGMSVRENTTLPILERLSRFGWVLRAQERAIAAEYSRALRVRANAADVPVMQLSGGNQQKIVLAKWLAARCRILLLDEPTRGVDVGAKAELHGWIDRLAREGVAVLLISSELPELLNLSTRVLVVREGRIVGERSRGEATQDALLRLMAGLDSVPDARAASA